MSSLAKLRLLIERFDGLTLRDRVAIGVALAVVIFFLVTVSMLAPDTVRRKEATTKLAVVKNEVAATRMSLGEVTKQFADDPVAQQQVFRDQLRKEIAEVDSALEQVDKAAPKMGTLVREMLAASPGVGLVSVKTLPVATVIEPTAAMSQPRSGMPGPTKPGPAGSDGMVAPEPPAAVFRHGIEVSLRGNYLALLPYLERLQKSSSRLAWSEAKLEVTSYPEARLTLVLYTLSAQPSPSLG